MDPKDKLSFINLKLENAAQKRRIEELEALCEEKDSYFAEMRSDGMRHGSSLAGKHMADLREYKKGK